MLIAYGEQTFVFEMYFQCLRDLFIIYVNIIPIFIQVHELKALPNKAKVQGMVAMRQPPSMGELVRKKVEYYFCLL